MNHHLPRAWRPLQPAVQVGRVKVGRAAHQPVRHLPARPGPETTPWARPSPARRAPARVMLGWPCRLRDLRAAACPPAPRPGLRAHAGAGSCPAPRHTRGRVQADHDHQRPTHPRARASSSGSDYDSGSWPWPPVPGPIQPTPRPSVASAARALRRICRRLPVLTWSWRFMLHQQIGVVGVHGLAAQTAADTRRRSNRWPCRPLQRASSPCAAAPMVLRR